MFGQAPSNNEKFKNVVLILSDDHRFDFLGFHEDSPDFLETPSFDRMSQKGAHMANAFVTTSLCFLHVGLSQCVGWLRQDVGQHEL